VLPFWTIPLGLAASCSALWALWHGLVPNRFTELTVVWSVVGVGPLANRAIGHRRIEITDAGISIFVRDRLRHHAKHFEFVKVRTFFNVTYISFRRFGFVVNLLLRGGPELLDFYRRLQSSRAPSETLSAIGEVVAVISELAFPDKCIRCGTEHPPSVARVWLSRGLELPGFGGAETHRAFSVPVCRPCKVKYLAWRYVLSGYTWAVLTVAIYFSADAAVLSGSAVVALVPAVALHVRGFGVSRVHAWVYGIQVMKHSDLSLVRLHFRDPVKAAEVDHLTHALRNPVKA